MVRDKITVVMADTSYSDVKADKSTNIANNRGAAYASVLLTGTSIQVEGVLSDGTGHGFKISTDTAEETEPDLLVGRRLQSNQFVKTVTTLQGSYVAALNEWKEKGEKFVEPEQVVIHNDSFRACPNMAEGRAPRALRAHITNTVEAGKAGWLSATRRRARTDLSARSALRQRVLLPRARRT